MDVFREAFNMLMILDKCMNNYKAAELMYNECYSKPTKVPYDILLFQKQISLIWLCPIQKM